MLTIADFQLLRRAYNANDRLSLPEALRQIEQFDDRSLIQSALAFMANGDRNQRVLALRILRHQRGQDAAQAILAGLNDPSRRVCAVAIQACPNYLAHPPLVARLEAIATDHSMKRKLRRRALSVLAGDEGRMHGDLAQPVVAALKRLMTTQPEQRFAIVFGLARLDLQPHIAALLGDFAASPVAVECEIARRALNGEIIAHIDAYTADPAAHQRIMQSCDIAHGRMFYWLPRAGLPS